jgi:hypothetical protein
MNPTPFNEPRPILLSAYERALDRFVHRVSQVPGVLAIYQIGSISCPGISDIDLIVVVDPSQGPFGTKTSVQMEDEGEAVLFFHQPIHVDPALMSQIYHLFYVSDLRRVWGEAIDIVEPTHDEEQVLNAVKLVEVLIFDISRTFVSLLVAPVYDVRAGLLRINALYHTLHLWSDGGEQLRKEWQEYADAAMRSVMELAETRTQSIIGAGRASGPMYSGGLAPDHSGRFRLCALLRPFLSHGFHPLVVSSGGSASC